MSHKLTVRFGTITEPQAELFELIVEGGVEFDDEFWSHVSETAKVCEVTCGIRQSLPATNHHILP